MLALWGIWPGKVSHAAGIWAPLQSPSVAMQLTVGVSKRSGISARYQNEFRSFQERSRMGVTCLPQRNQNFIAQYQRYRQSLDVFRSIISTKCGLSNLSKYDEHTWRFRAELVDEHLDCRWISPTVLRVTPFSDLLGCKQTLADSFIHMHFSQIENKPEIRTTGTFITHWCITCNIGKTKLLSFNFLLSKTLIA